MKINLDFNQIEDITIYYSELGDGETYFFSEEQAIKWTKEEMKRRKIRGKAENKVREETLYPSIIKKAVFYLTDEDDEEQETFTVKNS